MNTKLHRAQADEYIEAADRFLARHLMALADTADDSLELLIALASAGIRQGHVCLPLRDNPLLAALEVTVDVDSLCVSNIVGRPGDMGKPLIVDGEWLYLARYYAWEQQIIQALKQRLAQPAATIDEAALRQGLNKLFDDTEGINWQRVAAALAVSRRFCVISGGPGTGKTWTVARILELLLRQPGGVEQRIALAAPTGKAAARMTESIGAANPQLLQHLEPAQTLHRLLGMRPGRVRPRHHASHRLPLDLLIVDEVSMVDLPMMARLLDALPEQARLILLGDRHQLASVEAGQIMADLYGTGELLWNRSAADRLQELTGESLPVAKYRLPAMADHRVELRHSRRFDPNKGIGRLAQAVNAGDWEASCQALEQEAEVSLHSASPQHLSRLLKDELLPLFRLIREQPRPEHGLAQLNRVRVLCAVREGPQGVRQINAWIEQALGEEGRGLYHGQPVMVRVNDYHQKLFNGDIGLVFRNQAGKLRVYFQGQEGLRAILPSRLPAHETVYAMTIHKSQGSEFEQVLLVLPEEPSPMVSRELLYTGITRARSRVLLCATRSALQQAIARQVQRVSGLKTALWGGCC